ncbi:MAG: monofunctional biosynthetic peptidoglycan transglycosylase [Candidatus Endobugula sp.]|jgi:monofunctional biosynthetic peptidoglycan transglycosylase
MRQCILHFLFKFTLVIVVITIVAVLPLRWFNPMTTCFILSDDNVESVWIYQRWVALDNVAPMMQMAVIASEDQKFPEHYGFDFDQLKKVLSQSGGPTRGASTITQQLVKNIYLWPGKGLFRKGVEAYLTLFLELLIPKERILELYLNVIEFGSGVYGVKHASDVFFQKIPSQLNRVEASLMAAVLPNPKQLHINKPSSYVYDRALNIRFAIRNLGGVGYLGKLEPAKN